MTCGQPPLLPILAFRLACCADDERPHTISYMVGDRRPSGFLAMSWSSSTHLLREPDAAPAVFGDRRSRSNMPGASQEATFLVADIRSQVAG
jgi:hypothetical protein